MHTVMFVAIIPSTDDYEAYQNWRAYAGWVGNLLRSYGNIEEIGPNVWTIDLTKSVDPLGKFVDSAITHGLGYRILPFDEPIHWLAGGPSPRKA